MTRKAAADASRKRKASQQQDGSQGVSVLSSISLNKKVQFVSCMHACGWLGCNIAAGLPRSRLLHALSSRNTVQLQMQAVAKLGHCVQRDLRQLHAREQAAQVADAKARV
jgi:hypothetical protein